MQIASFSLLFLFPVSPCIVSMQRRARGYLFTSSLLFLFSIVCQSAASPLFARPTATQKCACPAALPGHSLHSRHSTDAPNNDPLWKLPPICYLNGETAPEVREVTGARPRPRLPRGSSPRHCIAVGNIKNIIDSTSMLNKVSL